MENKYIEMIMEFSKNEPVFFWVIVGILILILFGIFSGKKEGGNPGGMNPLDWQVFKRK